MRRDALRVAGRSIAWLVVSILVASCAAKNVISVPLASNPVASDKSIEVDPDEVRLWEEAEREEDQIDRRLKSYDDPVLMVYLASIVSRLAYADPRDLSRPPFTLRVLRDPTPNAFAMPNGRIYVHTGLLARLDNEAQLAMILGHEMTHVTKRHYARGMTREARDDDHAGAAALSPTANLLLGRGLRLATVAATHGYGRPFEREADADGMASLVRAGYDPKEGPKVFELLGRVSTARGSLEMFLLGDQSFLIDRVATTRRLLQTEYPAVAAASDTMQNAQQFRLRLHAVLRENGRLDIQAGRFTLAAEQLDRALALIPNDPIAQLYYGDLYRLQSQRSQDAADKADLEKRALERYERAAALDPAYADPFRQLGFLYYQQKNNTRAREAFEKYLSLAPEGPDAQRVKEYLAELDR
jgi:predicted Zn-dependent protease